MHSIRNYFMSKGQRGLATMLVALAGVAFAPVTLAQKTFGSPEEGMKELATAVKAHDSKALLAVLGNAAKSVVYSGDAVADRASSERFTQAYDEANKVETAGDKAIITVGKDAWPFPIPLVKAAAGWRFDAKQGTEELLNRRIGRNELSVIQVVQACVDAQREYYLLDPTKDKLLHYAQKFMSSKGKRDGLYYPTRAGEPPSPLGDLFARAQAAGYTPGASAKPSPYYGYYYRMLKAQGPDAPGGAYDYVVRGKMMGGFALVAYPATYGNSGVMTFIVNQDGVVYQKDLGPSTASVAKKMTKFNPDATWKKL